MRDTMEISSNRTTLQILEEYWKCGEMGGVPKPDSEMCKEILASLELILLGNGNFFTQLLDPKVKEACQNVSEEARNNKYLAKVLANEQKVDEILGDILAKI